MSRPAFVQSPLRVPGLNATPTHGCALQRTLDSAGSPYLAAVLLRQAPKLLLLAVQLITPASTLYPIGTRALVWGECSPALFGVLPNLRPLNSSALCRVTNTARISVELRAPPGLDATPLSFGAVDTVAFERSAVWPPTCSAPDFLILALTAVHEVTFATLHPRGSVRLVRPYLGHRPRRREVLGVHLDPTTFGCSHRGWQTPPTLTLVGAAP